MIDEEATFKKYGYYARDLLPKSGKTIVAVCDDCGKIREIHKQGYRAFCRSCTQKGTKSPSWKGGEVRRTCLTCGKSFYTRPSIIKIGKGKYCSPKCSQQARIKKIKRTCPTCGKVFYRAPSHIGKYCSKKCVNEKTKTIHSNRICEICGKEFKVHPSVVKIKRGRFCSHKCYWLWLSRDEETLKRLRESRQKRGLGKSIPEQIFDDINNHNNLDYLYVGDGLLWIGKDRKLNPDFIKANGEKRLVEIMGD